MKSQVVLDASLNCSELANIINFEIEAKPCTSCNLFVNETCLKYRCILLKPKLKVRCVFHAERIRHELVLFEGSS